VHLLFPGSERRFLSWTSKTGFLLFRLSQCCYGAKENQEDDEAIVALPKLAQETEENKKPMRKAKPRIRFRTFQRTSETSKTEPLRLDFLQRLYLPNDAI
jgi:hypothetical protein